MLRALVGIFRLENVTGQSLMHIHQTDILTRALTILDLLLFTLMPEMSRYDLDISRFLTNNKHHAQSSAEYGALRICNDVDR